MNDTYGTDWNRAPSGLAGFSGRYPELSAAADALGYRTAPHSGLPSLLSTLYFEQVPPQSTAASCKSKHTSPTTASTNCSWEFATQGQRAPRQADLRARAADRRGPRRGRRRSRHLPAGDPTARHESPDGRPAEARPLSRRRPVPGHAKPWRLRLQVQRKRPHLADRPRERAAGHRKTETDAREQTPAPPKKSPPNPPATSTSSAMPACRR